MKIFTVRTGDMYENAHLVINEENNEALVVDPGADAERILGVLKRENASLKAILLTHGHFDHIGAVADLKDATGAEIYIHKNDESMLEDPNENLSSSFMIRVVACPADVVFSGDAIFSICGMTVKVLETPGHTMGSVCYMIEDCLFTGDTIFYLYVGRTDFSHSSDTMLRNSVVNVLGGLKENYTIYSGHGIKTTLDFEKENNIYF